MGPREAGSWGGSIAMSFNWKDLGRFTRGLLGKVRDPGFRWTPRRVGIFLAFYLFYPLLELTVWAGLLLDEVLFARYRRTAVRQPVFIVGHPRSGTTFLHRLLARDRDRFTTMHAWEILLAPSVVHRRLVDVFRVVDRWLGRRLEKQVAATDAALDEQLVMQKVGLREPEEDDYLLLHIFSTLTVWLYSGVYDRFDDYARFDRALSEADKGRIMRFYAQCVRRHLFVHGAVDKQYLAKNPALTPKLGALYAQFPDAKVICLLRSPLETIPSYYSFQQHLYRILGDPDEGRAAREPLLDLAGHWYNCAIEWEERAPEGSYVVIRYEDLVDDPERAVAEIYQRLGFEISPAYAEVLHREAIRARRFRSQHVYSLEAMGYDRDAIASDLHEILERLEHTPHPYPLPDRSPGRQLEPEPRVRRIA
jgi:hypothetical protein